MATITKAVRVSQNGGLDNLYVDVDVMGGNVTALISQSGQWGGSKSITIPAQAFNNIIDCRNTNGFAGGYVISNGYYIQTPYVDNFLSKADYTASITLDGVTKSIETKAFVNATNAPISNVEEVNLTLESFVSGKRKAYLAVMLYGALKQDTPTLASANYATTHVKVNGGSAIYSSDLVRVTENAYVKIFDLGLLDENTTYSIDVFEKDGNTTAFPIGFSIADDPATTPISQAPIILSPSQEAGLVVNGTGVAGATIRVSHIAGQIPFNSVIVNASGNWSMKLSAISTHVFQQVEVGKSPSSAVIYTTNYVPPIYTITREAESFNSKSASVSMVANATASNGQISSAIQSSADWLSYTIDMAKAGTTDVYAVVRRTNLTQPTAIARLTVGTTNYDAVLPSNDSTSNHFTIVFKGVSFALGNNTVKFSGVNGGYVLDQFSYFPIANIVPYFTADIPFNALQPAWVQKRLGSTTKIDYISSVNAKDVTRQGDTFYSLNAQSWGVGNFLYAELNASGKVLRYSQRNFNGIYTKGFNDWRYFDVLQEYDFSDKISEVALPTDSYHTIAGYTYLPYSSNPNYTNHSYNPTTKKGYYKWANPAIGSYIGGNGVLLKLLNAQNKDLIHIGLNQNNQFLAIPKPLVNHNLSVGQSVVVTVPISNTTTDPLTVKVSINGGALIDIGTKLEGQSLTYTTTQSGNHEFFFKQAVLPKQPAVVTYPSLIVGQPTQIQIPQTNIVDVGELFVQVNNGAEVSLGNKAIGTTTNYTPQVAGEHKFYLKYNGTVLSDSSIMTATQQVSQSPIIASPTPFYLGGQFGVNGVGGSEIKVYKDGTFLSSFTLHASGQSNYLPTSIGTYNFSQTEQYKSESTQSVGVLVLNVPAPTIFSSLKIELGESITINTTESGTIKVYKKGLFVEDISTNGILSYTPLEVGNHTFKLQTLTSLSDASVAVSVVVIPTEIVNLGEKIVGISASHVADASNGKSFAFVSKSNNIASNTLSSTTGVLDFMPNVVGLGHITWRVSSVDGTLVKKIRVEFEAVNELKVIEVIAVESCQNSLQYAKSNPTITNPTQVPESAWQDSRYLQGGRVGDTFSIFARKKGVADSATYLGNKTIT